MITWGQRPNKNVEQVQALGSVATGQVHTFTPFRMTGDGVSLHPLQRVGAVGSASHNMWPKHAVYSIDGLGAGAYPAAHHNMTLPPVVPIAGSPRDPRVMI